MIFIHFHSISDPPKPQEEIILGGLLGRSSANLPSSIRSGVNVLKDTVQATKAIQQLSSISLTKRTCWSTPSTSTCGNSIPPIKPKHKNITKATTLIDKPASQDPLVYQNRIKDRINLKERPNLNTADKIESKACLDKTSVDFPSPLQDKLIIDGKQYHPHEQIMELKRQMASVRHDIQVSKVSLVAHTW